MRTYKLTISYDGTRYQGWQRQPGAENTIQNVIEDAICKLTGYEVKIQGSGRTDAGSPCLVAGGKPETFRESGGKRILKKTQCRSSGGHSDPRMELVPNTFHGRRSAKGNVTNIM